MTVTGTQQALLVWETTAHDITFEDVNILERKGARRPLRVRQRHQVQPGHLDRLRAQRLLQLEGNQPGRRDHHQFEPPMSPTAGDCAGRPSPTVEPGQHRCGSPRWRRSAQATLVAQPPRTWSSGIPVGHRCHSDAP